MEFLRGNTDVLDYLVLQMYTRGLSTRDVEEAFRDPATGEALLSRTAISDLTDSLWEDCQRFCARDLAGFEVEYVFLDAVYESLRRQGNLKEALLCAWAICRDGSKVLLHMALGNKDSVSAWREFIHSLKPVYHTPANSVLSVPFRRFVLLLHYFCRKSRRIRVNANCAGGTITFWKCRLANSDGGGGIGATHHTG
jgi:hypothetical protein